mmetsp:Transcript_27206/g.80239  ORF Transcript_27206/g.80239 Transcript_27206/m.80239 type:complete len:162 (-) Transcript_27206:2914-3399(-)
MSNRGAYQPKRPSRAAKQELATAWFTAMGVLRCSIDTNIASELSTTWVLLGDILDDDDIDVLPSGIDLRNVSKNMTERVSVYESRVTQMVIVDKKYALLRHKFDTGYCLWCKRITRADRDSTETGMLIKLREKSKSGHMSVLGAIARNKVEKICEAVKSEC